MSWIQVGLGASSPLLGLTVHDNMYLLLVSGKPKKHKRRWSLWCWQQFVLFALVHVFIIVWGIISEGNTTARAADLTPLTAEKRFRPWIFPWEELLCGFTFIPLIMYSRKVTAPYFSSEINICGFFNEHFATPSPFPREGTSTQGGGRGVTLIHSPPPPTHAPLWGSFFIRRACQELVPRAEISSPGCILVYSDYFAERSALLGYQMRRKQSGRFD